jgi:hypothetical protein
MIVPFLRRNYLGRVVFSLLLIATGVPAFSALASAAPDFSWMLQPTAAGSAGHGIALDPSGNVLITGNFLGAGRFGPDVFDATNSPAFYISKVDRTGTWLWTRSLPTTDPSMSLLDGTQPVSDSAGNVMVTGWAPSGSDGITNVINGTNFVLSAHEIFVAKYGPDGDLVWIRGTGGTDGGYVHGMTVDTAENLYLAGVSDTGSSNHFLFLKLDSAGNELARAWADAGFFASVAIQTDRARNIYVAGIAQTPGSIQGVLLTNNFNSEAFLAKFNPAGNLQWIREGSGDMNGKFDYSAAIGLAIDSRTNIVICGRSQGTNIFGTKVPTNTPGTDVPYLARFNACGSNVWLQSIPTSPGGQSLGWAAVVDPADNIYWCGSFSGTLQFGTTSLTCAGPGDAFLAMNDSNGNFLWALKAGNGTYYNRATSLAIGRDSLIVGGITGPGSSFGSLTSTNTSPNAFVAAIDFPAPRLGIILSAPQVELTWPTMPCGFRLQCTTNLNTAGWETNTAVPEVIGGSYWMTFGISDRQKFFRLYRPLP